MIKKEGAGRVRLANGTRMSYGAFVETMMESFPHAPVEPDWQLDELAVKVEEIAAQVKRMTPMLALDRAARDAAAGRLRPDSTPGITHHASEDELWK